MAGKGGVGKTTVGATIGIAAVRAGLRTELVELEGRSHLAAPFGVPQLSYEPTELPVPGASAKLTGRRITPDDALSEYLTSHGFSFVMSRLARSSAVELVATTAPGIRDLVTLGKIRSIEQAGETDLIVVDAPAAGHAVTFLRSASGMAATAPSGPVRAQADEALEMLSDPARCQVMLVSLPEETPVTELIETAFALEDEVGVQLGPIVVNSVWPNIPGLEAEAKSQQARLTGPARNRRDAAVYRLARLARERSEMQRLSDELPLSQIRLPFLFVTEMDLAALGSLADAFVSNDVVAQASQP